MKQHEQLYKKHFIKGLLHTNRQDDNEKKLILQNPNDYLEYSYLLQFQILHSSFNLLTPLDCFD